jgi:hypothetical protein
MDASNLAQQTLESSAAKALKGLSLAREYLSYGFTTLRDLGSMDPEFPTVDLRKRARLEVRAGPAADRRRAHHERLSRPRRPASTPRAGDLPLSSIADGTQEIQRLVRREHGFGSDGSDGQRRRLLQRLRRPAPPALPCQAVWKFSRDN